MKATCSKCQHVYFVHASSASKGGSYNRCPRCGTPFSAAKGTIQSAERSWDTSGTRPIVLGAYAGATGGVVSGIFAALLTLLGLGVRFSDPTTAMDLLISFLRILSLSVLTGMSLGWIREKTKLEVWGILGGIIGTLAGTVLCLIYEMVVALVTVGAFDLAEISGSVGGWMIRAGIVTLLVIVARKFVFPAIGEGSLLSPVSIAQQGIVGILCCLVVLAIGMEVKEARLGRSPRQQALKPLSSEGLVLRDLEESVNVTGDLVIRGTLENTTKADKAGWIAVAELFAEDGQVLRHATLINGLQMLNISDLEVLKKRGNPISPPNLSEVKGYYVLKPGSPVRFKVLFYGPPVKYKECSVTLKDLNQKTVQEITAESLNDFKTIQSKQ